MQQVTTRIDYLIREAFMGLRRGGWMNWAAVSTLTVLLFLLGLGLQVSWQLEAALASLGSQLEISIYLDPQVRGAKLQAEIRKFEGVEQVDVLARETTWKSLQAEMGVEGLSEVLGGNPLVDSLRIRASDPQALVAVAGRLKTLKGIDTISYGSDAAERLTSLSEAMRWAGLGIIGVLGLAAVAVITTTIRLIVISRQKEIEVMQLVGATPFWIYTPFVLEGLTFGVAGAVTAWGMLLVTINFVEQKRLEWLPFLVWQQEGPDNFALLATLSGVGVTLGILGSLIAVRRSARLSG
ncbi:MAG: ABC transporter permease [Gemmatimonadaceae bacterium]|nr:ABC transporter permease [Gloeobacterales cyanobacterium ES-bin-141]